MNNNLDNKINIRLLKVDDITSNIRNRIHCAWIASLLGATKVEERYFDDDLFSYVPYTQPYIYLKSDNFTNVNAFSPDSKKYAFSPNASKCALLPVIESKELIDILCPNGENEVLFGEYVVDEVLSPLSDIICDAYHNNRLSKTGNTFSFRHSYNFNNDVYHEYEFDGKKIIVAFIRNKTGILSKKVLEVQKINWIVDRKNNRLICEKALIGGFRNFEFEFLLNEESAEEYLKNVFFKELTQNKEYQDILDEVYKIGKDIKPIAKLAEKEDIISNPFGIINKKVSTNEKVLECLKNNTAVTLSGAKLEFDKSTTIDLSNPDNVSNFTNLVKSSANDGKYIICIDNIDKIIVGDIFDDYISNNEIESIINQRKYSFSNDDEINENLRFIIYEPNEKVKKQIDRFFVTKHMNALYDYAIINNLHPLLCVLIDYVGEEKCSKLVSENETWKEASRILYETNNIYILKGILGEELTNILRILCFGKVISVEDILNRNYTSEYLNNISIQQKYLQVAYLSLLDFEIEDLEVVRNFIIQMDNSMIELFDSLWSREDEKRKEKLNELFKTNNNILERKK